VRHLAGRVARCDQVVGAAKGQDATDFELLTAVPPTEVWVDPRLRVETSAIEGHGLFFTDSIPAGTVVMQLGGRLVSTQQLKALITEADADPQAPFIDTVTVFPDKHLVLPPRTAAHFGDHSCDPTLWHIGPYSLATRRGVLGGEEATIDYGTQSGAPGFRMTCRCGTSSCRGFVTSDDWRDAELQQRYDGHWVPALQALIDGG
jgi:uncharacterized protein